MESKPVSTVSIHDHLKPVLCDLYESDCIFDKFEVKFAPAGDRFLTGGYRCVCVWWGKLCVCGGGKCVCA